MQDGALMHCGDIKGWSKRERLDLLVILLVILIEIYKKLCHKCCLFSGSVYPWWYHNFSDPMVRFL